MSLLARPQLLYVGVLPMAAVLAITAWLTYRPLASREAQLDRDIAALNRTLEQQGRGLDVAGIERDAAQLDAETAALHAIAARGRILADDPLVRAHAGQAFQLIEFEQERSTAAQQLAQEAAAAGVTLPAPLEYLGDASLGVADPRALWAQLALGRDVLHAGVVAKVGECRIEAAHPPRELRAAAEGPTVASEIALTVRATGPSDRVQAFLEQLALGAQGRTGIAALDRVVLRKEGTEKTDLASATLVVTGLLPPVAAE